ncbi:MAG: biopolymer transporter ExbD [Pseudorhodobacter sp.]
MRKARKRRLLSMTSLIDVIFLLLLFFMLSSTFSRFGEVELTAARAAAAAPADIKPVFLQLGPDFLTINARPATMEDLASQLRVNQAPDTAIPVIVALKPEVSAQRLTDLLVVLRGVEGVQPTVLEAT